MVADQKSLLTCGYSVNLPVLDLVVYSAYGNESATIE